MMIVMMVMMMDNHFNDDCEESRLFEMVGGVEKLAKTRLCTWEEKDLVLVIFLTGAFELL